MTDPERKRLVLTAKKSLIESTFPIISRFEDAMVGKIAHGTVIKTTDKALVVEFFNNVRATVPAREAM